MTGAVGMPCVGSVVYASAGSMKIRFGVTLIALAPVLASMVNDPIRPSFIFSRWIVVAPIVWHQVSQKPTDPEAVVVWVALIPGVDVTGVTVGDVPPVSAFACNVI